MWIIFVTVNKLVSIWSFTYETEFVNKQFIMLLHTKTLYTLVPNDVISWQEKEINLNNRKSACIPWYLLHVGL